MNTTMNKSSCNNLLGLTADNIGKTFAYCLILVISLVGNILITIIVYKSQTMRKPINFFIVNMAMSDLLFPIFMFPLILAELYVDTWLISGPLGQALCKLVYFFINISSVVSIQSLVLIAVDRFGAVVFPFRSALITSKLSPFLILATWIIAMAVISPYLFAFKLVKYNEKLLCRWRWNEAFGDFSSEANYYLASYVVFLYIPIAFLTIIYSIILFKLRTQILPCEQPSIRIGEQRARRNRNVLKMAIAIVLGFTLCWLPLSIIKLLFDFAWDRRIPCGTYLYWYIAWFMTASNSALNPCICFLFSGSYRQGLKRILKGFGVM